VSQHISQFAVTVRDYDEAIAFYTTKLGFELVEDNDRGKGALEPYPLTSE
jgi:catechol 2,3-dioxygenase-like lactoylglutathione lyase family enzyme